MKMRDLLIAFYLLATTLLNASEEQNHTNKEADLTSINRMFRLSEKSAFNLEVNSISDFVNLSGRNSEGRKTHYLDNFLPGLDSDLDKVLGIPAAEFRLSILGNNGSTPNEYGSTIRGFSNIVTDRAWKLL